MGNTGSLEKAMERKGEAFMEASLQDYPKSGGANTRRTVKLTAGEALEVLTTALKKCEEAGIRCGINNLYDTGTKRVIVVLEGVAMTDGRLEAR